MERLEYIGIDKLKIKSNIFLTLQLKIRKR